MSTQTQKCPLPSFLHPRHNQAARETRTELVRSSGHHLAVARPAPKAHAYPLVGALPHLIRHGLDYFVDARSRYGDIYMLDLGTLKVLALNHPRHAQHVLVDKARNYVKQGPLWESIRTLIGNGLPVSEGSFWKRQRRMMQPQFHVDRLAAMTGSMLEAIDEAVAGWDAFATSGKPMDVARALTGVTMKVIVKTMFGTGLGAEQVAQVSAAMDYVLSYLLRAMLFKNAPRWLPVPGHRRFLKAVGAIDQTISLVIERRRHDGSAPADLLSVLFELADAETGERMTLSQLRDEVISFFLAGYETTAASLAWAFHYLLQQPALVRGLEEEVDALGATALGFEALPRLEGARRVAQEAMRLCPPSYWVPRVAVEDDTIDGVHVPAGTMVAPIVYAIHRHPECWEAPEQFDPDRFLPQPSAKRPTLAWMPFGAGQRMCIGKGFALMESQLILARTLQRFRFAPVPGRVTRKQVAMTLRPSGIWATLERRGPGRG